MLNLKLIHELTYQLVGVLLHFFNRCTIKHSPWEELAFPYGVCLTEITHRRCVTVASYLLALCVCVQRILESSLTCCWLLTPRQFFPFSFPCFSSALISFCPCCILCPFLLILFSSFSTSFLPGSCLFSYLQVQYHLPDTNEYCAAYKNKLLFCTTVLQQRCR